MAFKLRATDGSQKRYLFPVSPSGVYPRTWVYVSADAATTVDGSGYITAATGVDHATAINMLAIGDMIWAYQVASISDARPIEDDMKAGITDLSLHLVLDNNGSIIDLSDDLLAATPTYGD